MSRAFDGVPISWHEQIINLLAERVVIIDDNGMILYINEGYCQFIGTTMEKAIGQPVQDVIENSRMHRMVKTGKAELAAVQKINGSEMIANRFPIFEDGKVVGAVGNVMFRNPEEWRMYRTKIQNLVEELNYYQAKAQRDLRSKYSFEDLIGNSPIFLAAKTLAERVSESNSSVLLIGESGTGKELFAHAIHHKSTRASAPFVAINCSSIPEHLLESELFGYEDGAFTGAKRGGKIGFFEEANHGSLFLDEIGELAPKIQAKLLRVLQEREIMRVGGTKPIPINVRVIAATNIDLEQSIKNGSFREDLYFRLNRMPIFIAPLRKRKGEMKELAEHLIHKINQEYGRGIEGISEDAIEKLRQYDWPGNVRELENILGRAIILMKLNEQVIEAKHIPNLVGTSAEHPKESALLFTPSFKSNESLNELVGAYEAKVIQQALQTFKGNKTLTAKSLGISVRSLYYKMEKTNLCK
ncbi:sigma 54-interacting transcriptional regulator [Bacillus sp. JJ634]